MTKVQEIEKLKIEQELLDAKANQEVADLSKFIKFTRLNSDKPTQIAVALLRYFRNPPKTN